MSEVATGEWRCACGAANGETRHRCVGCGAARAANPGTAGAGPGAAPAPAVHAPAPAPHAHAEPSANGRSPSSGPPPGTFAPKGPKPSGNLPSPFELGGVLMCGFVAIGLTGLAFVGLIGLILSVVLSVFFYTYLVSAFKTVVAGQDELPGSPDMGEMQGMAIRYLALGASVFLPSLVLMFVGARVGGGGNGGLALILVGSSFLVGLVTLFFFPMAFIATSVIEDWQAAFNYPILIRAIALAFGSYVLLFLLGVFSVVVVAVAQFLIAKAGEKNLSISIIAPVLSDFVSCECNLLLAILAGKFYRENQDRIGWFANA